MSIAPQLPSWAGAFLFVVIELWTHIQFRPRCIDMGTVGQGMQPIASAIGLVGLSIGVSHELR